VIIQAGGSPPGQELSARSADLVFSVVNGSSVVWGTSLPWNNNTLSAFSVVWGSSTGAASATSVVWGTSVSNANGAFSSAGDDEQ